MQLQDHCLNGSSKPGGEAGVMLRELTLGASVRGCSPRPHCSQATQHGPACAETRTAAAAACAPADTSHNQHTVRHPCIPPAQAVSRGQVPELPCAWQERPKCSSSQGQLEGIPPGFVLPPEAD